MPEAAIPTVGARVMDLQDPTHKMSKSADSPQGTILVLDDLGIGGEEDQAGGDRHRDEVRFDPEAKPGVSNLLSILAAPPAATRELAAELHRSTAPLKTATAEAVVELLAPAPGPLRRARGRPRGHRGDPGQGRREGPRRPPPPPSNGLARTSACSSGLTPLWLTSSGMT